MIIIIYCTVTWHSVSPIEKVPGIGKKGTGTVLLSGNRSLFIWVAEYRMNSDAYSEYGLPGSQIRYGSWSSIYGTGIFLYHTNQCFESGMFFPDPTFFHPGSDFFPSARIRIKEFKYFNQKKRVSKLWKIWPRLTFYPSRILDPGIKKAPDPGSGSATLIQIPLCL